MLNPGTKLGHYSIVEKIGAGGMGEVYRARDERLERDVAIKLLPTGALADEAARKRFRKEALALSKLNHPNIQTVFDFDTQDGVDFLVAELVPGPTLAEKLAAGPLPEKEIAALGSQMAAALEEAHEHGVVHRDLKPANIKITPKGQVKILDFGLAKLLRPAVDESVATTESLTETQAVAGTLPYMAPEQLRGEPADARSDLWAAGAVLYEMATGQRPFREELAPRLIAAILQDAPKAPSGVNRRVSSGLESIILKALDKEPENRYQSARELVVDLRRLSAAAAPLAAIKRAEPPGTRLGGLVRKGGVAVAAVVLLLAAAAWFFYFRPAPALTESDSILLADFVNTTGDEVFDGTLKQALAVKLEESPFLNIVPEQRVRETLRLMERPPDDPVTGPVTREVCQRQGVKALLEGSIAPLGSSYVITLNAVHCQSGESLARELVQAASKEGVLNALGEASTMLREQLGESLSSIERFDTPLAQATTSSLEALKAFTLAEKVRRERAGDPPSIPYFKQAVELDPNFAMAYAKLGTVYGNMGDFKRAEQYTKKAFALRDRVSAREKFYITVGYDFNVTGNIVELEQTTQLWKQSYPRDHFPFHYLGNLYVSIGQYEKAEREFREALRLSPGGLYLNFNLAFTYRCLQRWREAEAVLREGLAKEPDSGLLHWSLYSLAFLRGDPVAAEREAEYLHGTVQEFILQRSRAETAARGGRWKEAKRLYRQAIQAGERQNLTAHGIPLQQAFWAAHFGFVPEGRETAARALPGHKDVPTLAPATFALVGEVKRAEDQIRALIQKMGERAQTDTLFQTVTLPALRALIEIQRDNPDRAVELLESSTQYELGQFGTLTLLVPYLRGQAYLQSGKGSEAGKEFRKILDNRSIAPFSPLFALAHLGSARAHALKGEGAKSRQAYEDFFELWKNADPDIPILQQAKAEYANLQ